MYHRMLVAYDGSPDAEKALQAAISMAKEFGAELQMVAVEEGLPATPQRRTRWTP